jgi:uracil-DNA glycosylase family 4
MGSVRHILASEPAPRRAPALTPLSEQLLADGADCAHCPLGRGGRPGKPVATEWRGHGTPPVALVGEIPGRREVITGIPFSGPSGKLLNFACSQAGIRRNELAILNAGACGPVASGADETKRAVIAACRPRLLNELRRLQPKVILSVGGMALRTLAPELVSGVTVLRGALLEIGKDVVDGGSGICTPGAVGGDTDPIHSTIGTSVRSAPRSVGEVDGDLDRTSTLLAPWKPYFTATLHPAHILRGGDGEQDAQGNESSAVDLLYYFFLYDLVKAHRLAHGLAVPWADELDLFVQTGVGLRRAGVMDDGSIGLGEQATPSEFVGALERVRDEARVCGLVACDTETDSKDSLSAKLTAIAYATRDGGVSATWNAYTTHPQALQLVKEINVNQSIRIAFHNGIYDVIVLARHNLTVFAPVEDTLLQHHASFPGLPHKLDQVTTQFFITAPWKNEFRQSLRDPAQLVTYNGRDALATARLHPALADMVRANKAELVYETDRQLAAVATRMRQVGFYVDRKEQARQSVIQHARLEYMRVELTKDFASIELKWRTALARILAQKQRKKDPVSYIERQALRFKQIAERDKAATDIGLFKPKAKADLVALFEVLRIPITEYTPKGAPVTDKKAMETASVRHPLMRRLIHIREAQHLLATYIDGLPIKSDGRVHPDWKTTKISGRWGAGKSQNVPKQVASWPPEEEPDGKEVDVRGVHTEGDSRVGGESASSGETGAAAKKDVDRSVVGVGDQVAHQVGDQVAHQVHLDGGVGGRPVGPRPGYRWKKKRSGDFVTALENPRAIVTAPTIEEILALPAREVPFAIRERARQGHDRILVGADFVQLELKIAALLGRDAFLLDAYSRKADVHALNASICFPKQFPTFEPSFREIAEGTKYGYKKPLTLKADLAKLELDDITRKRLLEIQKPWSKLRDLAKRLVYGWIYGGAPETAYEAIVKEFPEVELSAVQEAFRLLNERLVGCVAWRNSMEVAARMNREIREPLLGRARMFPFGNFNPSIVYNHPIQSMGASLLALSIFRFVALTNPQLLQLESLFRMGLLDARWLSARRDEGYSEWKAPVELLINGHDALTCETDEEDGDKAMTLLELSMTHDISLNGATMLFTAEGSKGRRWSET